MKLVSISKLMKLKVQLKNRFKRFLTVLCQVASQTHVFVEKPSFNKAEEDKTIFSIDINSCIKNVLCYDQSDYCVLTVFDKAEVFKGTTIRPGL